jgi:hypothetical protein
LRALGEKAFGITCGRFSAVEESVCGVVSASVRGGCRELGVGWCDMERVAGSKLVTSVEEQRRDRYEIENAIRYDLLSVEEMKKSFILW